MSLVSINSPRRLSLMAPIKDCGGRIMARWTTEGLPSSCRKLSNASPVARLVMASCVSKAGLTRKVWATEAITFCSAGVKARSACCTRADSWLSILLGTSAGFWVMKNTPTPLERIRRMVSWILSSNSLGQSSNSRCASSKKNTICGRSSSPRSGSSSYSSPSIHSMKAE
ncbi:hypothetical protein SDC9_160344 [bioreactor metagenome]|uniref:Uncharacterized protein n=1 Tax=bioreactor metagenome TaxID=1076179 RepID=A0A645FKT0_9ZZZZ